TAWKSTLLPAPGRIDDSTDPRLALRAGIHYRRSPVTVRRRSGQEYPGSKRFQSRSIAGVDPGIGTIAGNRTKIGSQLFQNISLAKRSQDKVMPVLSSLKSIRSGQVYALDRPTLILGRVESCDIQICTGL